MNFDSFRSFSWSHSANLLDWSAFQLNFSDFREVSKVTLQPSSEFLSLKLKARTIKKFKFLFDFYKCCARQNKSQNGETTVFWQFLVYQCQSEFAVNLLLIYE